VYQTEFFRLGQDIRAADVGFSKKLRRLALPPPPTTRPRDYEPGPHDKTHRTDVPPAVMMAGVSTEVPAGLMAEPEPPPMSPLESRLPSSDAPRRPAPHDQSRSMADSIAMRAARILPPRTRIALTWYTLRRRLRRRAVSNTPLHRQPGLEATEGECARRLAGRGPAEAAR